LSGTGHGIRAQVNCYSTLLRKPRG